ncbi:prepilin-type N-terminal cleavage/methylation domain-containing protein [Massilia sp. PAMC28688]|nr:prepilin-type N-terminal cleavage/methylation domain-containing protein [Massilia sp. PAMC28688]
MARRQAGSAAHGAASAGFTLVELIVVLVLIGILSAIAVPRMMSRSPFDAVAYQDQLAGLLRYGQKMAIAQNRNVFVRVDAGGIALCYTASCAAGSRVLAPGGANTNSSATMAACGDVTWACEAPPPQVRITPAVQFYFDPVGKPFAIADAPPTIVSTFTPLAISVSAGASVRTVSVEMETGYVR